MSLLNLTKSEATRRRACVLALVKELPEGAAKAQDRHLSLEVRGKRFAWYLEDHHDDGRVALHFKAPRGVNRSLAKASPERFHIPKYVGHKGWAGLWLDLADVDWAEVAELLGDAYRLTAPKKLLPLI